MDCVFFDLDDTLYDQVQPFALAYRQVVGERFTLDVEALFRASRKHSDAVFAASERGDIPMDEMHIYRLQMAFRDLGEEVDAKTCLELQRAYAFNQEHTINLFEGMAEILDWCKDHASVGIVTNGPGPHQLAKANALGMQRWAAPEAMLVSSLVGLAKPDPAIYRLACERLGTSPERCLFVGDAFAIDVPGAVGAGMPVVWFNHRQRRAPSNPTPDWEVLSVSELANLLVRMG